MGRHIGKRNRLNTKPVFYVAVVALPLIAVLGWLLRPQPAVSIAVTNLSPVNNVLDAKGELHVAWSTNIDTTAMVTLRQLKADETVVASRLMRLPMQKDHQLSFSAQPGQLWDVDIVAHAKWAHPTPLTRLRFAPQAASASQPASAPATAPAAR